ncbi:MAG: protoporphyrinogen oxidase HemJ [Maricaulaceae bacterium]
MSNYYEWFRAGHIIFVIFWMAGLLYLPRLFVYHSKAILSGEMEESLKVQERNLMRIIMNPSMIGALIFGGLLLTVRADAMTTGFWLPLKLLLVFGLFGYHGMLSGDLKKFQRGERPRSEKFYRVANEVPSITAIFIVLLAVVEPF